MTNSDLFLFVSHVAENRSAAMEIVGELERRGTPCWIAPRDVRPGKPFDDEIADAIEASRAMLLIFSDLCNDSEYIRREVTVAGESRKTVIPFRIEDVQPRRGLRVRLSDLHWIDGFVSRERAIDEVIKTFAPSEDAARDKSAGQASDAGEPKKATAQADAIAQDPQAIAVPPRAAAGDHAEALVAPVDTRLDARAAELAAVTGDPVRRDALDLSNASNQPVGAAGQPLRKAAKTAPANRLLILIGGAVAAGILGLVLVVVLKNGETPTPAKTENPAPAAADAKEAATFKERGDADVAKRDYDRAIADYTEAIRLDPKLAAAFSGRGAAYYEKGDHDRAIADQTEAIRLDPKYRDAYFWRGLGFQWAKQDYDRAIADYTEAIRIDPKYREAYFHRGLAYHNGKRDYDRAIADYTEAIRLDPSFAIVFLDRGLVYHNKREFGRAIADYTEAIRLDPKYRDAYFWRGQSYQYGKNEIDRAIADYTEAIRLNPKYRDTYYYRGVAYYNGKKDYDRAIADYTEAIRLDPNYAPAFRDRGLAYHYGKQDYDRAIADYTEAIRLDPKYANALYNRGLAKQKIGDTAGGDADIASAKALDPNVGK